MRTTSTALAILTALAVAGCASAGTSAPAAPPVTMATAATTNGAAPSAAPDTAPDPAASQGMCTTHACIVADLEKQLTGLVAQDESVATKVTCYRSTVVFHAAADTWSASCTADFSDGTSVPGTGNLDLSQQKVTFQPAGT